MSYSFIKPFLFAVEPERAHHLTFALLKFLSHTPFKALYQRQNAVQPFEMMGLTFPNPLGLAAGLDKDGRLVDVFSQMGFGFVECGTVTPRPQQGNAKPRLFRIPEANALINRMGFNNEGVQALVQRVEKMSFNSPLGINIGKNADTPIKDALKDYLFCFRQSVPHADYITINVSSPNTQNLRDLEKGEALFELLQALKNEQSTWADSTGRYVPLVVKISPDCSIDEYQHSCDIFLKVGIDGIIATNTWLNKASVSKYPNGHKQGGLSGQPLFEHSTQVIQTLYAQLGEEIPIIACGGVFSYADYQAKLAAGAKAVQVYTGFIYKGPQLVKEILSGLSAESTSK